MEKYRILCFADGNCPRESEVLQPNYLPPYMEVGEQHVTYYLKPENEHRSRLLQQLGIIATKHAAFSATVLAKEKTVMNSDYHTYALLFDEKASSFYQNVLDIIHGEDTLLSIGKDKPKQMRRLFAPKYIDYEIPCSVNFNSFSCIRIPRDDPKSYVVIKNIYLPNIIRIANSENTNP